MRCPRLPRRPLQLLAGSTVIFVAWRVCFDPELPPHVRICRQRRSSKCEHHFDAEARVYPISKKKIKTWAASNHTAPPYFNSASFHFKSCFQLNVYKQLQPPTELLSESVTEFHKLEHSKWIDKLRKFKTHIQKILMKKYDTTIRNYMQIDELSFWELSKITS
jgi:hypothetical protein